MRQNYELDSDARTIPIAPFRAGGHLPCLDGLRGIAILMVILCHFAGDYRPGSHPLLGFLRFGSAGVDLFFVLSGFLITGSLFDSRLNRNYYRDFYIRRILRIIPLYYAVLVAAFVILPIFHVCIEPKVLGREMWFWCFASNLIQGGPGSASVGCFGHFWSLAVEEHFYLIWPFVIRACSRKMGICACIGCIALSIFSRIVIVSTFDPLFARNAVNYWTPCRIEGLAVGGLIALISRGPSGRTIMTRFVLITVPTIALALASLVYLKTEFFALSSTTVVLRSSLCAWISGAVLATALLARTTSFVGQFLASRTLRQFGKYSYALYIFHFLLMPTFEWLCPIHQVAASVGSELVGRLAFLATIMTGSWVFALVSWYVIEKPFLAMKDTWAPREVRAKVFDDQANIQTVPFKHAG